MAASSGSRLVAPVQAIVLSPDPDEEDPSAGGAELWRQARRVRLGRRLLPARVARRPPPSPPPPPPRRTASSDPSETGSGSRRGSCDITLWSDAELMTPPVSPAVSSAARRQRPRPASFSFRKLRKTATSVFGVVKFSSEAPDEMVGSLDVPMDRRQVRSSRRGVGGAARGVEGEGGEKERIVADLDDLLTLNDSNVGSPEDGARQKDRNQVLKKPPLNKKMSEIARRSADRILQSGKQEQQILERFVLRENSQERQKRARARSLKPPPSLSASSNASSAISRPGGTRTISVRIVKEIHPPGTSKLPKMLRQAPGEGTIALENAKKAASLFITSLPAQIADLPQSAGHTPASEPPQPSVAPPTEAPAAGDAQTTASPAVPEVAPPSAVGWTPSRRSSVASVTSQVSLTPAQRRAFLKKLRLRRNVQVPGVMYTDQARAAAVALGEHDIKYSLKNRRFLNRGHGNCWVSEDSTFVAFSSHAQLELRRGDPAYAIQLFDRALEFEPKDESCLASRAKCNLLLGNNEAALKDAEVILSQNPRCARALAQKAEALYALGEFEMALVFYSRGLRLRPDMTVFTLGVDTATEAIENAVGDRAGLDFSGVEPLLEGLQLNSEVGEPLLVTPTPPPDSKADSAAGAASPRDTGSAGSGGRGRGRGRRGRSGSGRPARPASYCRPVLEELAVDKEYMERLIQHPALSGQCRVEVVKQAEQAITFLEKRQQFWAKQKPVYTRQMERRRALGLLGPTSGGGRGKRRASSARPAGRTGGDVGDASSARLTERTSSGVGGVSSARSTSRTPSDVGGASSASLTDRSSGDVGGASSADLTDGTSSGVGSATSTRA